MNVGVFSRYSRMGASSRLRMLQYCPILKLNDIKVTHNPFFSDEYLINLYEGKSTRLSVFAAYIRRIKQLWLSNEIDILWIEKELLPWIPWALEKYFLPFNSQIVTDYDDAVFHLYDINPSSIVRRALGRKIDCIMAQSALVFAGNAYLAERAWKAGARRIEIVPTVVDSENYAIATRFSERAKVNIGWIGTPSTWSEFLAPMLPLLIDIASREGGYVTAVGAGRLNKMHPLFQSVAWREETEVEQIQDMDIGLMPLTDSPWARGKCGYKLIQYMACGIPVIASPVGVNSEIVEHGVNGFLASTETEWKQALTTLLRDSALRKMMGAAGRSKVESKYSLKVWGPRVVKMLESLVNKDAKCST